MSFSSTMTPKKPQLHRFCDISLFLNSDDINFIKKYKMKYVWTPHT